MQCNAIQKSRPLLSIALGLGKFKPIDELPTLLRFKGLTIEALDVFKLDSSSAIELESLRFDSNVPSKVLEWLSSWPPISIAKVKGSSIPRHNNLYPFSYVILTTIPAVIAFVVAMAGIMFPAIDFTSKRDLRAISKI
uniref:Uncharacterized protein n=1 Tax=Glossina pallidipes TaxID=7398 RepID=A0A1A9ZMK1_GLOPL